MSKNIREKWKSRRSVLRGFTLLELMVVMAIIVTLAAIAVVRYERSHVLAKEAVLSEDLHIMRDAIQQFTQDNEHYPSSLDDLKTQGYITDVPNDPFTGAKDWTTKTCDDLVSADQTSSNGVCDVFSSSDQTSVRGTPYNAW